jgi:hypothetical protein
MPNLEPQSSRDGTGREVVHRVVGIADGSAALDANQPPARNHALAGNSLSFEC